MTRPTVAKHSAVYLTYSITDEHGTVVEQVDLPVAYVHGANSRLFEKIETALEGRCVGEQIEIELSPADGFGSRDEGLTFTDDLDNVPPQYRHLDAEVLFENDHGERLSFRVTRIEAGRLTLDANHPLAGQTVKFIVRIVDVRNASPQEIENGVPLEPGLIPFH